jgi:murein DD-endopeptidase MepM/ murein hydrolase activator NlpD
MAMPGFVYSPPTVVEQKGTSFYGALFPGSSCNSTRLVDLDAFYQSNGAGLDMNKTHDQNQLLSLASGKGKFCTYGGYLEDRTNLWAGVYPLEQKTRLIHLGADINNVVVGQPIASLTDGVVFHILNDLSPKTGWGGRVLVRYQASPKQAIYLMYAHLDGRLPKVGTVVKCGQVIGYIGEPTINGGWFPHLHLQVMNEKYIKNYMTNLDLIDGYAISPASKSANSIHAQLQKDGLIDPIEFIASLQQK